MMKDGRSQGGLNTVCLQGEACDTYQAKIIAILGEGLENSLWPARGQFARGHLQWHVDECNLLWDKARTQVCGTQLGHR
jgi:hypothetical protein